MGGVPPRLTFFGDRDRRGADNWLRCGYAIGVSQFGRFLKSELGPEVQRGFREDFVSLIVDHIAVPVDKSSIGFACIAATNLRSLANFPCSPCCGGAMTEHDPNQAADAAFDEGFVGVSPSELARMSDAELATLQSGWKPGTDKHILAEKEWQRRTALRQMREQFKLDERIANGNRWWSIAAAAIGIIGTLVGVVLGKWLDSPGQEAKLTLQTELSVPQQQQPSGNSAASTASSSTSKPEKKTR